MDFKPREPFFNQITAALFEERHTRGPFKLLPYAEGGYVVFDTRAPLGQGVVAGPIADESAAHAELERVAAAIQVDAT